MDDVLTDGQLATLSRGRIMKAVDEAIEECLRHCLDNPGITKEKDAGLRFEFAPLGLESILLAYRSALADEVAGDLSEAGIPVYIGRAR